MSRKFLDQLAGLAKISGRDLSVETFALYDQLVVQKYGEEKSVAALHNFAENGRGLPAPSDLLLIIRGPKETPKQRGADIATLMLGQISRRGHTWVDTYRYDGWATFDSAVENELGTEALQIVNRVGGWPEFCRQFDEGVNGNARAQLRDICETQVIRRIRSDAEHALEPHHDRPRIERTAALADISAMAPDVEGMADVFRPRSAKD